MKGIEKWDLPKGRAEGGEDIETTSLREVEEETGVENLSIERFLQETYHIYKSKGQYKLKVTYWYLMNTDFEGELAPQLEEGITKAVWKTNGEAQAALENSYANVKLLLRLIWTYKIQNELIWKEGQELKCSFNRSIL